MYLYCTHIYSYAGTIPCPYEGDYRCPLSGICIRSYEVCDGSYQCYFNGDDEQNCSMLLPSKFVKHTYVHIYHI